MSSVEKTSEIVKGSTIVKYIGGTSLNFFFFGCWNKVACDDKSELKRVVGLIQSSRKSYDFGIIAGDNVYPDKTKTRDDIKVKYFPPDRLDKGIACISRLGYELYAVLGNHDVEDCAVFDDMKQYKSPGLWHVGSYYAIECNLEDTLVVFLAIDTNLFDLDVNCYKKNNVDIEMEKAIMLGWLIEKLEYYNGRAAHVIIVGHEPLFGYKNKNGKYVAAYYQTFGPLIKLLFKWCRKVYYMCADIHNYQHISLFDDVSGNEIEIITCGTGGASPDETFGVDSTEAKIYHRYRSVAGAFRALLHDMQSAYGYCDVTVDKTGLRGTYVQAKDEKFDGSQSCTVS